MQFITHCVIYRVRGAVVALSLCMRKVVGSSPIVSNFFCLFVYAPLGGYLGGDMPTKTLLPPNNS